MPGAVGHGQGEVHVVDEEAAVALAMIIAIYRKRSTVDVGEIDIMKW